MRERRLALGRGAAGRFSPGLLALGAARKRQRLARAETGVRPEGMEARLARLTERLAVQGAGLVRVEGRLTRDKRAALEALGRTLATLGPQAVLARGYAVVRDGAGKVLTGAAAGAHVGNARHRVRRRPGHGAARRGAPRQRTAGAAGDATRRKRARDRPGLAVLRISC